MPDIGNRRVVVAVLLAATIVLAGCSGGGGPTPTETTGDESTDATETNGDTEADVDAEGEIEVESLGYDWQDGESYTYESEAARGVASQYTWDVTDVSGGEVTANLTSSFGTESNTTTITGPQGDVFGGEGENAPVTLPFRMLQIPQMLVQNHTLQSGNSWTVSSGDLLIGGSESGTSRQFDVRVTGTSQVQGEQCYRIEATTANESVTGCVKEDWPFALSMSMTAEVQGQVQTNAYTLVEYDRP